ncbi:hypothetical protein [Fontivita pretiosa]|uniref:hypothetical protein n=1 Tax=Fontivita pretiosa TaxID=2989684 RepID=UPI003D17016B
MQALKADPRKTAALGVLLLLLVVMVARSVLVGRGPARAAASNVVSAVSNFITGSKPGAGAASGTDQVGGTGRESSAWAALQKWADAPVGPISRNLFAVRMEYFPADGSRTTETSSSNEGFWEKLEKSLALQADQRDKRENLIANYRAEASKLKLQSTMPGAQPRALVNGELVAEGSVVAGFRVLKIESRRIIVEREGIRLEVLMK